MYLLFIRHYKQGINIGLLHCGCLRQKYYSLSPRHQTFELWIILFSFPFSVAFPFPFHFLFDILFPSVSLTSSFSLLRNGNAAFYFIFPFCPLLLKFFSKESQWKRQIFSWFFDSLEYVSELLQEVSQFRFRSLNFFRSLKILSFSLSFRRRSLIKFVNNYYKLAWRSNHKLIWDLC